MGLYAPGKGTLGFWLMTRLDAQRISGEGMESGQRYHSYEATFDAVRE